MLTLCDVIFINEISFCKSPDTELSLLPQVREEITIEIKYIFWHVNPLIGNDSKISSYTTAVVR
jgi:hypothetical protein